MAFVLRPVPTRITSWSFTRYSAYDQCPYKLKLTALEKRPEPKGAALTRGADIHTIAEAYLKAPGRTPTLPVELKAFGEEFKRLRTIAKKKPDDITIEDTWAFRRDWGRTTYDDWNGCWLRVKLDVAHLEGKDTIVVTDFKTGKFRQEEVGKYLEQLELYDLAALLVYKDKVPNLRVRSRLLYLDAAVEYPGPGSNLVRTVADIPTLTKTWETRAAPLLADTKFAPKPNQWCRTCHFRKANNGPCKY